VQVLPAPVRAARLVCNGQCRESNHDGCRASIDMRDYQQFRDTGKPSQEILPDGLNLGKDGELACSFRRRAKSRSKGFFTTPCPPSTRIPRYSFHDEESD
jgi:hypothetical protein